jgi:hypothetical protein
VAVATGVVVCQPCIDFGVTEQRTHDYKRHGTTNLFAALNVATGTVPAGCYPQRSGAEFLAFLRKAVKPAPARRSTSCWTICPLTTHPTCEPGWTLTPTSRSLHPRVGSSWMNQIGIWFGIITRQAIRRGTFVSVNHLIDRIRTYVQRWNADALNPSYGPPPPTRSSPPRPTSRSSSTTTRSNANRITRH